jgi:surface carbohydrate biosynthesis protein
METIALPIENQVREFDGKLWLGLNFVERGYNVVLGPSWEIKPTLDIIKPDVYFTKDPGDGNVNFVQDLQESGIVVCGVAPEVNINDESEYFINNRQNIIKYLDMYFAWGDESKKIKHIYDDVSSKIKVTGNPRFDLLTESLNSVYSTHEATLREKYGNYILINTNFVIGNNTIRENLFDNLRRLQPERDVIQEEYLYSRVLHSFLELIIYLVSEGIDQKIVVRPHPNEDHSTYNKTFKHIDQVFIEHEKDVRYWIYAADGVIHYDCTTGLEAAVMNTPVLSYQSVEYNRGETPLPQTASKTATNRKEAKEWITESAVPDAGHPLDEYQKSEIRRYLPNIDRLAAPLICDSVDKLLNSTSGYSGYNINSKKKIERQIKSSPVGRNVVSFYDWIRDVINNGGYRKLRANRKKKFPGITPQQVRWRSEKFIEKMEMNEIHIERVPQTRYTYSVRGK